MTKSLDGAVLFLKILAKYAKGCIVASKDDVLSVRSGVREAERIKNP